MIMKVILRAYAVYIRSKSLFLFDNFKEWLRFYCPLFTHFFFFFFLRFLTYQFILEILIHYFLSQLVCLPCLLLLSEAIFPLYLNVPYFIYLIVFDFRIFIALLLCLIRWSSQKTKWKLELKLALFWFCRIMRRNWRWFRMSLYLLIFIVIYFKF